MAVLPIRITGDPVLHTPAAPVEAFDDELKTLVDDMFETMDAAPGVGLAAPQVGVSTRLFVFGWTDEDGVEHRGAAVNPVLWITPTSIDEVVPESESEGCLSFPGERFPLRRADRALLRAQDVDGQPYEIEASGWLARIFQHEYDHLNGVLYVDRLPAVYAKEVFRITKKKAWGIPGRWWMPGVDDLDA